MKRILITPEIEALAHDYACHFLRKHSQTNVKHQLVKLGKQIEGLSIENKEDYICYVNNILENFDKLLVLKPSGFDSMIEDKFSMLSDTQVSAKIFGERKKNFADRIVEVMHYATIRKEDMPPYIQKMGIKTCVYCNANYIHSLKDEKGDVGGRYELDHFYPKSQYPFLCVSFFNLQPSCSSCNKNKLEKRALFSLYTENPQELYPFRFDIESTSICRYLMNLQKDTLQLKLESADSKLQKNHDEIFKINDLYNEMKDECEETIWRELTVNDTYIEQLREAFGKVIPENEEGRFVHGFYLNPEDIHKRPLTLLHQSLMKQIGTFRK